MSDLVKNNVIGTVSPEQRDEIRMLYARQRSLKELFLIVKPENKDLYERVVADMAETKTKYDQWWADRAEEYHWGSSRDKHFQIDFESCVITLCDEECKCNEKCDGQNCGDCQ